ncbi:MAG: hypothetical protein F6K03_15095, partial [Kamptonema sp. SIO4C4]|nr:hypothetical protein [Kamptonema sp. SIO4C4]
VLAHHRRLEFRRVLFPSNEASSATEPPTPTASASPSPSPSPTAQATQPSPSPESAAAIREVPANLPSPTPPKPSPSPASPSPRSTPTPPQNLNFGYQLVGVVAQAQDSVALFKIEGTTQRYSVGEVIGESGWTLVTVENNSAIIRRNGEVRSVVVGQDF